MRGLFRLVVEGLVPMGMWALIGLSEPWSCDPYTGSIY